MWRTVAATTKGTKLAQLVALLSSKQTHNKGSIVPLYLLVSTPKKDEPTFCHVIGVNTTRNIELDLVFLALLEAHQMALPLLPARNAHPTRTKMRADRKNASHATHFTTAGKVPTTSSRTHGAWSFAF